jgi:peptidylprolyl isomerase
MHEDRGSSKKNKKKQLLVFMDFATKRGSIGRVIFELFYDVVPRTARNFLELAEGTHGFGYHGCKIHRIVPGFVIQGGDFTRGDGSGGRSIYGERFEDENFKIKHDRPGLLSMANAGPDTNGSQFFITLSDTHHLNDKHVVFGEVIQGMDVVQKIATYGNDREQPKEIIKIVKCGQYFGEH